MSNFDNERRALKQRLALAETAGDTETVKKLRAALDTNATAKEKLLRLEAEAAAEARKAAAEAEAGDPELTAKTPPKGRTAVAPKATTDSQGK